MKIAVPLVNGNLSMHFGHCDSFAVMSVGADGLVTLREDLTPPPHEPGLLPRWLHEQGAEIIIAGGMGQRAQQLFSQQNIVVVTGAPSDAPDKVVQSYLSGTLRTGANLCDH